MPWYWKEAEEISRDQIDGLTRRLVEEATTRLDTTLRRVLLLPPDLTRAHSGAGRMTETLYRTRLAIADGGELLIVAPGLQRFGEQDAVDALIRKYGYCGRQQVLDLYRSNADLQTLAHAAAHLIHGSTDSRFTVRYAPGHLSKHEIEAVHFAYADLASTLNRYPSGQMTDGWNTRPDGERVYFIRSPSAGLWATPAAVEQRLL